LTDKKKKNIFKQWSLTPKEELLSHNLETKKFWLKKINIKEKSESETKKEVKQLPEKWKMLKKIKLRAWQKEVVDIWFKKKKGTIKVVTGAGKTILALAIIEKLQKQEKDLHVAIVVPTVVLLNQWYEEIKEKSNLPEDAIGFLGAGYEDNFNENQKRIIICVLKSATKKLPNIVEEKLGSKLLLVVDECHRAGAPEMRKVFKVKRKYGLGLSATPEREDSEEEKNGIVFNGSYNESLLGREIGPLIYEMSLKQAFDMGILPGFELKHYGLPLTMKERSKYDSISHSIKELNSKLKEQGRGKKINSDSDLWSWCQSLSKQEGRLGDLARLFVRKTRERKYLLYNAKARNDAVVDILKGELKNNPNTRAILFHERIEEVMNLYNRLLKKGISVVAENSQLSDILRETSIDLFRRGIARVIVSARSLIEGFNVPSADIGIIVASSTSVRQRIQTLGRVLRKTQVGGKEKKAVVYVLYMDKTTDEYIYEKTDWNKIIGAERNRYFFWDLQSEPKELKGPPRNPPRPEEDIDEDILEEGEIYPGEYEGIEYSCDSRGNVSDAINRPAINPQGIPEKIFKIGKEYGRFKVTPHKKYVLLLKKISGNWQTYYVTKLVDDFNFERINKPGETFYFKQKGGRYVITKKHPRGELYARIGEKAEDKTKGKDALKIIDKIQKMQGRDIQINKFFITIDGQVKYLEKGELRNIITIKKGLEFPEK
jgi:superfamily II DNA or RNA helicase